MDRRCNFCSKDTPTKDEDCTICGLSKPFFNPFLEERPATNAEKKRIAIQMDKPMYYFIENPEEWNKAVIEILDRRRDRLVKLAIDGGYTTSLDVAEATKEFQCHTCESRYNCRVSWDAYNIGDDWCLAVK